MKSKIIGIIVCIILIVTVFPVSSSIVKNEQNSLTKPNKISNFNNKELDFDRYYIPDFPVMKESDSFFEPDEISPKPVLKTVPSQFNWMTHQGKDWTTPGRNQKHCGSCWAFAALGVFESIIEIEEDCAELNPDLSEQYILSCIPKAGDCGGGSINQAFKYIIQTTPEGNNCNGIIPESCFPYRAIDQRGCDFFGCDHDPVLCTEKCANWEEMLVPLVNYGSWRANGSEVHRQLIKTQIIETGPVATGIKATNNFKIWGGTIHNPNAYYFHLRPVSGRNHVVVIVGWKDSSIVPNGGYWICKNSWGQEWGYDGFFNIAYNCLNIDSNYIYWADYDPNSFDWPPYVDTGGPYGGYPNQEVTFDASKSMGFEGNIIDYSWDFGDENTGSGKITTHTYENLGKYTVTLTVLDSKGNSATKTTNLWIQETNDRPDKPTINGPKSGKTWEEYEYSFSSTDPDGNDLLYYIDWGDNRKEEWIGPSASGGEITSAHIWIKSINKEIKAKVKDPYGEESEWATFGISMPKYKLFNLNFNLLNSFIERLPNAFPILKHLMKLILQ